MTHDDDNKVEGLVLVSGTSQPYLNPIQEESYRDHRRKLATWLLHMGKDPTKAEGYAWATAQKVLWRLDKFYRFVWDEEGGYTTNVTPAHADDWMRHLAHQDFVPSYKSDCQKAVKILFKWQSGTQGKEVEWGPVIIYSDDSGMDVPRDYLTRQERQRLREATLEYGIIPP